MKTPIPLRAAVSDFTENDLRLKRFLDLTAEIKELSAELEQIKEEIKHRGTYATTHYVATVSDETRTYPPSLQDLVGMYGESIRRFCKTVSCKRVKVSPKGGV
jgi:hypothetical protein